MLIYRMMPGDKLPFFYQNERNSFHGLILSRDLQTKLIYAKTQNLSVIILRDFRIDNQIKNVNIVGNRTVLDEV